MPGARQRRAGSIPAQAARQASRSFTREPVRSTAPAYRRAPTGTRATALPTSNVSDSAICHPVAAPRTIRTGIASAALTGRIEATTASVEFGSCSDPILRLFDAADFLESPRAQDLYAHAYSLVDKHRIDQVLGYSDGKYAVAPAIFRKSPGLGLEAPIDARALEVVLECTPEQTLGDLVEATAAARGEPVDEVKALVGETVRQLVEKGFMVPVVTGS